MYDDLKKCSRCEKLKFISEFSRIRDGKYLRPECKSCAYEMQEKCPSHQRERRSIQKRYQRYSKVYGLSKDEFNAMLEQQDGKCAICKEHPIGKQLMVDHNHSKNFVRELLCNNCNSALGFIKENEQVALELARYIRRWYFDEQVKNYKKA